jgi:FkbM family methyltransferase
VNHFSDVADLSEAPTAPPDELEPDYKLTSRPGESLTRRSGCLNRSRDFVTWPHFNPGQWIDTNPTFIRLSADDAWAVFTRYRFPPEPGSGSVWVVRLDGQMQPACIPMQIIDHGIDPRVVRIGGRLLIFYAMIEHDSEGQINGSCMAVAEFGIIGDDWIQGRTFQLPKHPINNVLPRDAQQSWEKNWVPFAIDQFQRADNEENGFQIGLIYSHDPWYVVTLGVGPDRPRFENVYGASGIQWDFGTIRGGTPPVPYDDTHLVTFFHSAQLIGSRNVYSVGACVFLAEAPYTPVFVTSDPLLIAPYHSGSHRFGWHSAVSVVFPLGAERTAEGYRLLCGRDDGEIASFMVSHDELSTRLDAPQHGPTGTVHDYRGGTGARLPLKSLLYVPDPIPAIPELPMINFVRTIAGRGRTFVDVGSHIGFYTMGLAPGFQRVIAFEPSRFQYEWLRRNATLNAYDHVECEHVALGDAPGTATLNVLSYEGGLNSLVPEVAKDRTILDNYAVRIEVLDDRNLTDVDLLKIDVEGFEIQVLRGAARTIAASRPVILIEVWADTGRRRDVKRMMNDMRYSLEFLFPLSPELAVCLPLERRHEYRWFI